MKIENHIAHKLLTDENFVADNVIDYAREIDGINLLSSETLDEDLNRYISMGKLLNNDNNRTYYVTKSVTEHMALFNTKKCMEIEGWRVFKGLKDFKKTFILPDVVSKDAPHGRSAALRVRHYSGVLHFYYIEHVFLPKEKRTPDIDGVSNWTMLYINLEDGVMCDHINSPQGIALAPFLYSLMCFVELCDNQVVEVLPKSKWGTQKSGKFINSLPFPVTVINNTWNIMTVRSEGFPVSGHVHLFWTGPGKTIPKLKYVSPYMKDGYTRRSGKEING